MGKPHDLTSSSLPKQQSPELVPAPDSCLLLRCVAKCAGLQTPTDPAWQQSPKRGFTGGGLCGDAPSSPCPILAPHLWFALACSQDGGCFEAGKQERSGLRYSQQHRK